MTSLETTILKKKSFRVDRNIGTRIPQSVALSNYNIYFLSL